MGQQLLRNTLTTLCIKNLAAGAGDPFGGAVDMSGWNGCLFTMVATSAASTGGQTITAYHSTTSTATSTSDGWTKIHASAAQIASTARTVGSGAKGILQLDIWRPQKRYVTARLTRTTSVVHGGTLAQRYDAPRMISSTKTSTDALTTGVIHDPQSTG